MGLNSGWLKNIGADIAKGTAVAAPLAQLGGLAVATVAPQTAPPINTFEGIVSAVVQVEGAAQSITSLALTGPQKAQAAGALTAQVLLAMPFMQGKKVADLAKFQAASATIAGGVADLLNSLEGGTAAAS